MREIGCLWQWLGVVVQLIAAVLLMGGGAAPASELADTIDAVKPSVVAVGTYQATRRPPARVLATGFAVADGHHIATNAHVLPDAVDTENREFLAAFQREGDRLRVWRLSVALQDGEHDLALLRLDDHSLPPIQVDAGRGVREGELYAFTGFPIGAVLGLSPVTHRGIVSSITPIAIPADRGRQLDTDMIKRLREPYPVYQLDATAYPGNSGSPLYDPASGGVVGVLNSVFVKESKEAVLERPSGIAYAIPARHLSALLDRLDD